MVVYAKAQLEQECLPSPICTDSDIDDEAAFDSTAEFPRLVIGFCGYFFFFFFGGGGGGWCLIFYTCIIIAESWAKIWSVKLIQARSGSGCCPY